MPVPVSWAMDFFFVAISVLPPLVEFLGVLQAPEPELPALEAGQLHLEGRQAAERAGRRHGTAGTVDEQITGRTAALGYAFQEGDY